MIYEKIRNKILKYDKLFNAIHFFYTPIRIIREYIARREMAVALIERYKKISLSDKKIFYFGIPEHNNLGDMAQTYCTRKWLFDNYPDYKIIEIRTRTSFDKLFLKYISDILSKDDIFIFQSGYCTRDKNLDHLMHVNIMGKFPGQKAVILPQTVNLQLDKEIEKTKKIFTACDRLLFIARDRVSYEQAKLFTKNSQLELFPDIVTSLIGRVPSPGNMEINKKGVLVCVRNDDEKFYIDEEINKVMEKLREITDIVDKTDTNSHLDVWETYRHLDDVILEKINTFGRYAVIITDRYHGTIFSLIANTPVIVIKTNDHKVTSGVDWFKGVYDKNSVRIAENLNISVEIAGEYINQNLHVVNNDYFYKTFYQTKLKRMVDNL